MTPAVQAAVGRVAGALAVLGHRALDRFGGGALEARMAVWAAAASSVTAAARAGAHQADLRHHGGGYDLFYCAACGRASVIEAGTRYGCVVCDGPATPPAAGLAAGARPGVVSDGSSTTAPTPGHPDRADIVPAIAAVIDHHRSDLPALVAGDGGSWTLGKVRCRGIGCKWAGDTESDHATHVAELIGAMQAADQRIADYYNAIRKK